MNALTRWDPFQDLMNMRQTMDQFVQGGLLNPDELQPIAMRVDISETPDAYEISASIPGVKPEEVDITLDNNTLTIRGEVREEQERDNQRYHVRERRVGVFARSIILPSDIDANAVEARMENGVLKLHLPKMEESKSKRIQVQGGKESAQTGKGSKMIEGQSRDTQAKQAKSKQTQPASSS